MKIEEGFLGQIALILPPAKRKIATAHPFLKLLYPTAIGYYPLASYHERERITGCEDYILLYCVDGQGFIVDNGQQVQLNANTYYILPKNSPHRYGSAPKKPWSIFWMHFNGKQAEALHQRYCVNRNTKHNSLHVDIGRNETFNELLSLLQGDFDTASMELLYIRLLHYLASFTHPAGQHQHEIDDAISRTLKFMKDNVRGDFDLKHFAAVSNYSVTRFSQLFRSRTGYAPIQYFLHMKIYQACQFLSFTNLNIAQVAEELGFNDQFYFSRIFKKMTGTSPLLFRKQHNNLLIDQKNI